MNLDEKLRQLKQASHTRDPERGARADTRIPAPPGPARQPRKLPAQRAAKGIEEYVDGQVVKND